METKEIIIYHNPRCGKSRTCVNEFASLKKPFTVRNFITEPFSAEELKSLVKKIGIDSKDLLRQNDLASIGMEKEILTDQNLTENDLLKLMIENPKLIQRPIVEHKGKAVIARPFEKIYELNID